MKKRMIALLSAILLSLSIFTGCGGITTDLDSVSVDYSSGQAESAEQERTIPSADSSETESAETEAADQVIDPEGSYTTKEDVALYLETYDQLPDNFITKKEARDLGWPGGSLEEYAPGFCIGGDYFGNREGKLPKGAKYNECDINTLGASSRGAERLVFAGMGDEITVIYYTNDHYNTFEKIYEE